MTDDERPANSQQLSIDKDSRMKDWRQIRIEIRRFGSSLLLFPPSRGFLISRHTHLCPHDFKLPRESIPSKHDIKIIPYTLYIHIDISTMYIIKMKFK